MTAPTLPAASPPLHRRLEQAIAEARGSPAPDRWRIEPDDRIGDLADRRRGRLVRRGLLLSVLLGAGAVHHVDATLLPWAWEILSRHAAPLVEEAWHRLNSPPATRIADTTKATAAEPTPTSAPQSSASGPDSAPRTASIEPPPSAPPAVAPATPTSPATNVPPIPAAKATETSASTVATGSMPAGSSRAAAVAAERAPESPVPAPAPAAAGAAPPYAPPPPATDPLQKRAEAAGLHPGLSRTLLARLTDADYRNATAAVRTALIETPDDGEHVQPRRRAAGLAQFRVHFVPGADAGCRRYVVTIARDGWLTTALPMERCGVRQRQAARR